MYGGAAQDDKHAIAPASDTDDCGPRQPWKTPQESKPLRVLFGGRSVDRVRATEDDARDRDAWINRGIIMPQGGFGDRCLVCGRLWCARDMSGGCL